MGTVHTHRLHGFFYKYRLQTLIRLRGPNSWAAALAKDSGAPFAVLIPALPGIG